MLGFNSLAETGLAQFSGGSADAVAIANIEIQVEGVGASASAGGIEAGIGEASIVFDVVGASLATRNRSWYIIGDPVPILARTAVGSRATRSVVRPPRSKTEVTNG
jgi:hypothetical protein